MKNISFINVLNQLKKAKLVKSVRCKFTVMLSCLLMSFSSIYTDSSQKTNQKLIFLNIERLELAQKEIEARNMLYLNAYDSILTLANVELSKKIDPVTNKTIVPASGNKHDYHTIGSYYWPDSTKKDGLPWIYKDGQINPMSTGYDTDWLRLKEMLSSLQTLNLAYYFSGDKKYILKAKEIVRVWFMDKKTKVNPNVDYGKAIPGEVSGTNFAVIDWTDIGNVITTIQLLDANKLWKGNDKTIMDKWLTDYYKWLTESEFGILESTRTNNHGTNYDYQLIGIMIYLGKLEEASAKLEEGKKNRISTQIDENGGQPLELARTKSVNYTVNNLWALARITDLGRRFSNVDLWDYENKNGASLAKAFGFVIPYITGESIWAWTQITGGGAQNQLKNLALPMFSKSELMLDKKILPNGLNGYDKFDPQDVLMYAPIKD